MDNFDKRIKQIAKDENWKIPNEIDNNISKLLKNIEEPKTVRKRQLKVAILVASLSILTITTAFAIENHNSQVGREVCIKNLIKA